MHPPSSTLWRLTKLHLHWEHRGNVFKIAPATKAQQIQDIKRCDQIPFTCHCWLVSITTSRQTYAIYRHCWNCYSLYLQQYKGKHSRMELLSFKAEFSWGEQFGVFHICRQLSRPLAVLCEQLQRSPGCSWQHRRGTSPRPKSQHNFFDWLWQCSQIDQCFYRIRV